MVAVRGLVQIDLPKLVAMVAGGPYLQLHETAILTRVPETGARLVDIKTTTPQWKQHADLLERVQVRIRCVWN